MLVLTSKSAYCRLILTSPRGTRSSLLLPRPKDKLATSFEDWPFLSVHYWGEDPTGQWTLQVPGSNSPICQLDSKFTKKIFCQIENAGGEAKASGLLKHWQLVLYGTEESPLPTSEKPHTSSPTPPKTGEHPGIPLESLF